MKIKSFVITTGCLALLAPVLALAAPNPASQDWVNQQIALAVEKINQSSQGILTTADWNAACSSGTPADATGCWGDVSSPAFTIVNNGVGGFTTFANINPTDAPEGSVFIKAFLGGTNQALSAAKKITVTITAAAGRCSLFTQVGRQLGPFGIANQQPAVGTSERVVTSEATSTFWTIRDTSAALPYANKITGAAQAADPIYLICAGYDTDNGYTAASLRDRVTATA